MSEQISNKETSTMDLTSQSPRAPGPFVEEDDTDVKTEIKTEENGHASPLFVPPASSKRKAEDEISPQAKRTIRSTAKPIAYGGNPVKAYVLGKPYNHNRVEPLPDLEVNGVHHKESTDNFLENITQVVLPTLSPYRGEDRSLEDSVKWFEESARIPAIAPTRFALSGNSGSGKTTTLNNVAGVLDLANAAASMESVTQVPQIFNHGTRNEYFRVEILFINGRSISSLVMKCVKDLVDYVKLLSSDETEEDLEHARLSAEAGRQVIDDLFSHQDGLKSLDDAEGFLESKSLLPADSEDISETAFESLCKEIQDRAVSEGIDLDTRSMFLTAGNVGELHAKTMRFSERGAFASIVSSIRTKFYSPLLAMGIEVADLPGLTDTNLHLRKTSLAYSINCPKAIFVADLLRCMTTPDLEKSLRGIIKMKGAENVCLVLRGKENVEKTKSKWSKEEIAQIDALEKLSKTAQSQQAPTEVERIEREIRDYRIKVRDRIVTDHFHQKRFQNKNDAGKIRVITVANKCHEKYMRGSTDAILSWDQTGIKELRAYMCETPSRDRVRAFARHSAKCITKMRRLSIWADGPKMPPRDAALALFAQHARWSANGYLEKLFKASKDYRKTLQSFNHAVWAGNATKTIVGWSTKYAARTQGVFIRQGGRHNPKLKGSKEKKPKLVSWNEDLLTVVEDDVLTSVKSIFSVVKDNEGSMQETISDGIEKIRNGLEMLDTIGGANLDGVFELFNDEAKQCIRDIREGIFELKQKIRETVCKSIADEPCDVESPAFIIDMVAIYNASMKKFPKGSKNLTKERTKFIVEQVTSAKGPFSKMTDEICTNLKPVFDAWAFKATGRVEQMHRDLRDVLFKSFEGKKMPDARREQIAPAIKAAMEKARAVLQADLDGYSAEIL
ncbi:hypothetical protein D6D12_09029 [Aureobasidium pullulans]|uniref:Uncharacterized protein n=1 Tax=Aureobasidium pullulans TaxID=5580 RepID=A0AB74JH06_AURPU|nr:hypothetical protein D6D12_09029 [Aureobasidium pullulans]